MFYKPALLPVSMNYIIAVWSLIGVVIKENGVLKVAKHYPFGRFFLLFIPLIVYLFVAINFTSGDSSIISLYAIYFSYIIQGYYAVLLLRERFQCYDDAMMMIVRVGEVQCILTLLMAFISPLRDSILSYLMSNNVKCSIYENILYSRRILIRNWIATGDDIPLPVIREYSEEKSTVLYRSHNYVDSGFS